MSDRIDFKEWKFGETPTTFLYRLDHFLQIPVYYEELELGKDDSIYDLIGLPTENRTMDLKLYHAMVSVCQRPSAYKVANMRFIVGHLLMEREHSTVVIIDGYPTFIWLSIKQFIIKSFEEYGLGNLVKDLFKYKITYQRYDTFLDFNNAYLNVRVLAEEQKLVCFELDKYKPESIVPDWEIYNEYLTKFRESQHTHLHPGHAQQAPPAMSFDDEERRNILKMVEDDDDDDTPDREDMN